MRSYPLNQGEINQSSRSYQQKSQRFKGHLKSFRNIQTLESKASSDQGNPIIVTQNFKYPHLSDQTFIGRRLVMSMLASSICTLIPVWNTDGIDHRNNVAWASYIDSKTGISLPSPGEIEQSLPQVWEAENVFQSSIDKSSFTRLDNTPDSVFYSEARFVEHVDENAVTTMTRFISSLVSSGDSVLDLCSSWTSHVDPTIAKKLKRVAGLGMNAKELEANPILTEWTVMDLNAVNSPTLPYTDGSFDTVLCQLSIDYLIHPLEVMREVGRVMKVGGKVAIVFSNRLFIQKVRI